MAPDTSVHNLLYEAGMIPAAPFGAAGAPVCKRAPAGESHQAGALAFERDEPVLWNGVDQRPGIRVPGILEDLPGRADLDNLARIENRYPIAEMFGKVQVMRDKKEGSLLAITDLRKYP